MVERVIVLVDMDCFYCQVETKLNPLLFGRPVAVVQYNAWKGGGIIAVNYEARDRGVTRHMRGDDAKSQCPEIQLVSVPTIRNKADLSKYRDASRDVIDVLCTYSECVERASIDEAYLDLTESIRKRQATAQIEPHQISNTFVIGYSKEKCNDEGERESGTKEWLNDIHTNGLNDEANKNLAVAASIVEEIRAEVFKKTGFRCSAGIAHNKILAKLACGLHKPNRQTVLPHGSVSHLYKTLSIKKVRHLGGKLGDIVMERLNCAVMADLFQYSEKELKIKLDEKNGSWLYNMARGIDHEPVKPRLVPKSIGCCKRFPGKTSLKTKEDVTHWLNQLTEELTERLLEDQSMNKRKAQLLTVSMTLSHHQATSKSIPFSSYDHDKIFNSAYHAIRKICSNPKEETWSPIFCLGLSASKFLDIPTSGAICSYFQASSGKSIFSSLEGSGQESPSARGLQTTSFFSKFVKKTVEETSPESSSKPDLQKNVLFTESSSLVTVKESVSTGSEAVSKYFDINSKKDILTCFPGLSRDYNKIVETPHEKTSRSENNIKSFFIKQTVQGEDSSKKNHCSGKRKGNSIQGFLKNQCEYEVVNPLDVFPDLSVIDDEMLQSFPISFRRKVLDLKKDSPVRDEFKSTTDFTSGNTDLDDISNIDNNVSMGSEESLNNQSNPEICKGNIGDESGNWDCDDIFEKSIKETNDGSTERTVDFSVCPECGGKFDQSILTEHIDFHIAQRISLEINAVPQPLRTSPTAGHTNPTNPVKRKQSGKGKINASKKFKTIKTFFGN